MDNRALCELPGRGDGRKSENTSAALELIHLPSLRHTRAAASGVEISRRPSPPSRLKHNRALKPDPPPPPSPRRRNPTQFSDGAFTGVSAVQSLHLDNNKLRSLPKSLDFATVTNLTLANNPWSCTCQLAPLRRWMDSSRSRPDAVCASPPAQRGKHVRDSPALGGCRAKGKRAKKGARH